MIILCLSLLIYTQVSDMCIFTFINMCKCIDDGIGTFDVVRFHSKYNHIIYTKRWMHIADSIPPVA